VASISGPELEQRGATTDRPNADSVMAPVGGRIGPVLYLVLATVVAAVSLAWLGYVYRGEVFLWELDVLTHVTQRGVGAQGLAWLASRGWLWSANLISDGANAPFFSVPTAVALKALGFRPWSARLVAMGWTVACIPLAFAVVRRFFSPLAAAGTAVFLALSPFFLFDGMHAFSLSANRFFAIVALFAVLEFCRPENPRWWDGVLCAGALYLATVQYTPGRLLPLIGLPVIAFVEVRGLMTGPGGWLRERAGRLAVLLALVAAVVAVEARCGRLDQFISGGGESVLGLFQNRSFWHDVNGRPETALAPGPRDVAAAALHLVRRNLPEVAWHLRPTWGERDPNLLAVECPPRIRLLLWWQAPLVVLGLAVGLRRFREPQQAAILLWFVVSIPAALLCTYLRSYRIDLWTFPLAVWFGLGADRFIRWAAASPLRRYGHVVAIPAILGLGAYNLSLFQWPGSYSAEGPAARAMAARVRSARGDLYTEARFLHNWTDMVGLVTLERRLSRKDVTTELTYSNGETEGWRELLTARREEGSHGPLTMLLAPADHFKDEIQELRSRWGASVRLEPLADSRIAVAVCR
jgi:hypothetical protein